MDVSGLIWVLTLVFICVMLTVDFVGHVRTPHAPTIKESAGWSIAYVAIGLGFGLFVWNQWGSTYAGEYYAGYITEKSLSVDNLFVFVLIMASFAVPRRYQPKVLLFGIVIALVLRAVFIFVGAAMIERLSWIFYIFGAFLVYTAWTQVRGSGHDPQDGFKENRLLRISRKIFPTTEDYVGDHFFTRQNGKRFVTPLFIVIIAIGSADLLFAVDSIPAIFGLTQETYLVFTANAFSLLGLRQLFFLIDGLLDRLVYLSYGLGVILAFIGAKLIIHALHTNDLPFINGGEEWHGIPEPSIVFSLVFILATLVITTVASLRSSETEGGSSQMQRKARGIHAAAEEAAHLNGVGGAASGKEIQPDADPSAKP